MGGVSWYVCDCAPAISSGCTFCRKPRVSRSRPFNAGYIIGVLLGAGGSSCINFAMCASTLLQLTENCSPKVSMSGASRSPRILPGLKRLGPFECLGVVEIVVHYVQSMHHDWDCDVIDREGHPDLHTLVCSLNVGRTR